MYCPECGNEIRAGLNYCNRCGSQVEKTSPESRSVAHNLSNALGAVAVFGILGFIAMLWVLLRNDFVWAGAAWICLFYLMTIFGISAMMIKQIAALTGTQRNPRRDIPTWRHEKELTSSTTAQLFEPREPTSVIEHTTRTLDEVAVPRK
jgi:hypothetical protein